VQGRLVQNVKAVNFPLGRYEIRVAGRTAEGSIATLNFRDLMHQSSGPSQSFLPWQVTQQEISAHQKSAPQAGDQAILPKDHSLRVSSMEIDTNTDIGLRYLEQLSEIGQIEDFHVFGFGSSPTEVIDQKLKTSGYKNYTLHRSEVRYTWLEDSSETLENGTRLASNHFSESSAWVRETIENGRRRRLDGLAEGVTDFLGQVNGASAQRMAAVQALVNIQPMRQAKTYLEFGNILPGKRQDGTPYVLVGEDTLEVARSILQKQRPEGTLSPAEVKAFVAQDLGVEPSQLFAIEQPGSFHIDMRMMSIGPGQIALQDSREAASLHLQWLKDEGTMNPQQLASAEKHLKSWAEMKAPLEELTERDLRAAGLEVHRIAGAFPALEQTSRDAVNFFNARHGVSSEGARYSIIMGGPPQAESHFTQKLLQDLKAPIDRIYFLDPEETGKTLKLNGGLKCRTKVQGRPVAYPIQLTPTPVAAGIQLSLFEAT
jgi:hypothetical protein